MNPELFRSEERHAQLLDNLEQVYHRSDEEFILAFKRKYSDPMPPGWMILEVTSFGSLLKMYRNLNSGKEKREIAGAFGLPDKT